MINKRELLIMLLLMLCLFFISSVSASDLNNTDVNDEMLAVEPEVDSIASEDLNDDLITDANNEKLSSDNEIENTLESEIDDEDSGKIATIDDIKVTSEQIGNEYKNTKLYAKFTYGDDSPYSNKEVLLKFKSWTWEYEDTAKLLTDENGEIEFSMNHFKPDIEWKVSFNIEDGGGWKQVGTNKFKIKYIAAKIKVSSLKTYFNSGKKLAIRVLDNNNNAVKNAKVTVHVSGIEKTMKTNSNGYVYFNTKGLKAGKHNVRITMECETLYDAKAVNSKVEIKPIVLSIKTKSGKINTRDLAGGIVDIYVKDKSSKKALNGISLTLKIKDGKKYKTVKLVTGYDSDENKDGVAGIFTNQYSVGTHKVIITPTSKNYKGSATAKIVITKSAKKNYYNFHIYFTKGKIVYKVYK